MGLIEKRFESATASISCTLVVSKGILVSTVIVDDFSALTMVVMKSEFEVVGIEYPVLCRDDAPELRTTFALFL